MPAEGEMRRRKANVTRPSNCLPSRRYLQRLRERRPRVHCITNVVAQNFTANMLLAAGAVPSMTIAQKRSRAFAARADALLINLGTFDSERAKASLAAVGVATKAGIPWVLDPVFIDRSAPRAALQVARGLKQRAVRLNSAELALSRTQSRRRLARPLPQGAAHRGGPHRRTRSGRTPPGLQRSPTAIR